MTPVPALQHPEMGAGGAMSVWGAGQAAGPEVWVSLLCHKCVTLKYIDLWDRTQMFSAHYRARSGGGGNIRVWGPSLSKRLAC